MIRNWRALLPVCASILALLVGHAGAVWGELIVNASFEIPSVGPTGISVITPGNEPPGFGWSVDAGSVEVLGEQFPSLPGPSFDGEQHLDLNGTSVGTLAQAFTTTPGHVYRLSFAYANNYAHTNESNPASAIVGITDSGTAADLVSPLTISHGTSTSTDLDWTVGGFTFTAIGPSSTLRFASNSATPFGGILLDGVGSGPDCDFTDDDLCNIDDLDSMLAVGPIAPGVPVTPGVNDDYDLTNDGLIDLADRDEWLDLAAMLNELGSPYKLGDADLDGTVDGQDFIRWKGSRFTSNLLWSAGNFNGDGFIDGQDFLHWNANKFTSSDGVTAVPEPAAAMFFVALIFMGVAKRRC